MNDALAPIFEVVIPELESYGIPYWVYGGVAIAGINGEYLRHNPDVDVFVMSDDYDRTIGLVTALEKQLKWKHCDAKSQRGRQKSEWRKPGSNKDIFSVIEVYPAGESALLKFGSDFVPQAPLTAVRRTIGPYWFVTPSKEFIKELLISKVNSRDLNKDRIKKLKIDAKVIMSEDEYSRLSAQLDAKK